MQFLVVFCAALAVATCKPAAVGYAYSAVAPAVGYPFAQSYGYAPFAYSASPAVYSTPVAAPAVYSAPVAAPVAAPVVAPVAAPVAAPAVYSAPVAAPAVYSAPVAAPAVYSAPVAAPVVAPVAAPVKSQYHSQDEFGQASYGHAEPTQSHNAVQDAAGNKVGSFSFVNAEGKLVRTDYVADAGGYRVASNDLPAAPLVAPVAPLDTPEVAAAKAAHLAEVAKAASQSDESSSEDSSSSRKKRSLAYAAYPYAAYPYAAYPYSAYPYAAYPHAYPTTNSVPVVTADGYLADTPEVAAAKAVHFAEHAAAKARGKRAAPVVLPAATAPLTSYVAPYSPLAYSAYPYSAYPYSAYPYAAYPHAYPTTNSVPVVTADGFIADTPEVTAAKAVHFAEHAAAKARGKRAAPVVLPAATAPLTPYVAPYSPLAYSYSAYPYSAYPYSAYPYSAYPYSAFYKK